MRLNYETVLVGRRVVLVLPAEGGSEGRPPASLEALPGLLVLEPDGGLR